MNARTRYFVISSLLVLTVGVGTGLVAYYMGFPTGAFVAPSGPEELQFVPSSASLVAYANVHEVMTSDLRQRLRAAVPAQGDGQREFQERTGINIETDIDRVVAYVVPEGEPGSNLPGSGLVLARGRFDEVKIEALMREHGAEVEDHRGKRLVVAPAGQGHPSLALAFLEPGLVAVGGDSQVRLAVDLSGGGASITTNAEMMDLITALDSGNAWAVGRFDLLVSQAKLPSGVAERLPPITWFSASANIDGGLSAALRAEAVDEQSGNNLRDVIRGFMTLAKLQAGSTPQIEALVNSLQLGGAGKTVEMSFDVPTEVIDALAALGSASQTR